VVKEMLSIKITRLKN